MSGATGDSEAGGRQPSGGLPPAALPALSAEARDRADRLVAEFMGRVAAAGRRGSAWQTLLRDVETIGQREIHATAELSRRMSAMQLGAPGGPFEAGAVVARALRDLRGAVGAVDPSRLDLGRRSGRFLGFLPRSGGVDAYLARYEQAQGRIREIVTELVAGRAELERDYAVVTAAQHSLAAEIEGLGGYAYLTERLDRALDSPSTPPPAAQESRRTELLFAVRRRRQEILTQLAIATQGLAALEIVARNNAELIRSVETATSSTLAALRTGVMVAQALAARERLTESLRAAHEAAAAAVEAAGSAAGPPAGSAPGSTARTGLEEGVRQPASGADLDSLRRAWGEVFAAMNSVERYRKSASDAAEAARRQLAEQAATVRAEQAARERQ